MTTIRTGCLEDDFCLNLKAELEAGIADKSNPIPRVREVNANIPVSDNGPYPNMFIQWESTEEGDKTTIAYPVINKHRIIRANVILVNNHFSKAVSEVEVRDILRKAANWIETHSTLNGFCQDARVLRIESGEQAFLRTAGHLLSHGIISVQGEVIETLTHA